MVWEWNSAAVVMCGSDRGGAEKGRGLVGRSENWKTVSLPLSLG